MRTAPVPEAMLQVILARAEGNPLFLEELAYALVEQGGSHRSAGVPTTIQAVLASRIDRLPPEAKRLLQMASVIGKDVAVPRLEAIAGLPPAELQWGLAHLQAAELLYETTRVADRTVTFKHALIREAAYHSLLRSTRQEYHQRIAQGLEERFPGTAETQPELLAHHYTEAGLPVPAVTYWQRAGQQARQRSANPEAIQHLTKGLALLATFPETPARAQQELELQIALGPALMATHGPAAPEVEQTYARARVLCARLGEIPQLFPALRGLCRFYQTRGALPTARELGEQLLRLAQRTAVPTHLLEAHDALGTILLFLGEYTTARTHIEQGIALTDPAVQRTLALRHDAAPGVTCLALAALTLWCLGAPVQALRRSQEVLGLAQALAHPLSLALTQHYAALLHHRRRDAAAVQAQANALLTLATTEGFPLWKGFGTCWHDWALAVQGQGEAGLAQLRQGFAAVLATGQTLARPLCLVLLAEAAGHVGQIAEGLRFLAEALMALEASGRGDLLGEVYRLQGEFLLRQAIPDTAQAEACFQQALSIARRRQAKSWELRAAMSLSRLWQRQGKREEARQLLADVYSWFTEGFDTADLQEARALLAELS